MTILTADNLTCEKSDRTLFSDLDLSLNASDLLHLKGDNGAGKTSLLRILVGLSEPQAGKVTVNGIDVHQDQGFAASRFIYLGHKLGVSPVLSATENLRYWSKQQGLDAGDSKIESVLDDLEMTGLEDVPVKFLSAGQQRKVGLAKLWIKEHCNLWVLDEPFNALDVHMVAKLEQKMMKFVSSGAAILMTSHQHHNLECPVQEMNLEYRW